MLNLCVEESDDQEVGKRVFREKLTINFKLLEVCRKLSRMEESLSFHLRRMDIPFLEIRELERFANSVAEIIRLIDRDIVNNLISDEVMEYTSPTKVHEYARWLDEKISSVEAQINGLHDCATTLGLTSAKCEQRICLNNNLFIEEAVAEEERKDAFTVSLEEDIQVQKLL